MSAGTRSDLIGRIIGMLVFLLGVALLVVVFYMAYGLYNQPAAQALGLKFTGNPKTDPQATTIGVQFGTLLFRIAYLFIMSIAGSLVANKGINLYFSALQGMPVTLAGSRKTVSSPPT
ncbi:MAG TPA: hypothetical protein VFB38_18195 [Chthonomonadaceae bacterium]|nr:hypothetical protein [Chthonomonadaceae bacterium]